MGFLGRLSDQLGIGVAAFELGEAPEEADDAAEAVGSHPRDSEGAASTAAAATDPPLVGIVGDVVGVEHHGEDLGEKEGRIGIGEGVVLDVAVAWFARIDKHPDCGRHLAMVDEVVEHDTGPDLSLRIQVHPPVLEHHQPCLR
jgi:hypothetical protein